MKEEKACFLIGVGGAGMSALARYFLNLGYEVLGYDRLETSLTEHLKDSGVQIFTSWDLDRLLRIIEKHPNLKVITTPAVKQNNPYLQELSKHYKTYKRSEVLGEISRRNKCLSVAGTHGKTTISSMLATIYKEANQPMIAFLGGESHNFTSNFFERKGADQVMVVEADEYDRSFMRLKSHSAVIANVDPDHLDVFGNQEGVVKGFQGFAATVEQKLLVHESCQNYFSKESYTYGLQGDFSYQENEGLTFFFDGKAYPINKKFFGKHNIENALGAFGLAVLNGISPEVAKAGIESFSGVKRRFDVRAISKDITYIDDYAHHPSEIEALHQAVSQNFSKPILGIFEPHLYSRTVDFADEFRKALGLFDKLFLLDLYPAREEIVEGVNSDWLAEGIQTEVIRVQLDDLKTCLKGNDYPTVVSFGAGTIGKYTELIEETLHLND